MDGNKGERKENYQEAESARIRMCLGMAQMFGASVTLGLLVMTGINEWTLGGVVVTSMLTVASVLLFGGRRRR